VWETFETKVDKETLLVMLTVKEVNKNWNKMKKTHTFRGAGHNSPNPTLIVYLCPLWWLTLWCGGLCQGVVVVIMVVVDTFS